VNDDCLKLTAYFGERQRHGGRLYADDLFDVFGHHQLATSILLRGAAGFGRRHNLRTDQSLSLSEDPPVVAVAVDTSETIQRVVRDVMQLQGRGTFTLERARLLSPPASDVRLPDALHEATKLTVYVGRQVRVGKVPAFAAVCDLLYRRGVSGASVLVGVDGTANHRRQRARFFDANSDVPTMIIAVAPGERIAAVVPELSAMLEHPVMTLERVRVCKRDGQLLVRPHVLPGVDAAGLGIWQKMMVHTSESTLYHGEPLHRALVRRLRSSCYAGGATVLRGMWGFHGDHPPHGDRLLQLGRRVPVVTVIVDTPERVARSFDIVDELTVERGLVTTEMVPAVLSVGEHDRAGGLRLAGFDF
jgi:PII-like signaling protein